MALVIGLAGTIAAGKSTVGQILMEQGAVHCDGDKLVHTLYATGTPGFDRIVAAFGADVIGADGEIDRKILGAKVFGNREEMNRLTAAIGPISEAIHDVIARWRAELPPNGLAVMEAINLMEPGFAMWCDRVWLIAASDPVAKARLLETRGMSEAEADQRLASMVPMEVRAPGADWVYLNDGGREELEAEVVAELERTKAAHAAGTLEPSGFVPWWKGMVLERGRDDLKKSGVLLADEITPIEW